MSNEPQINEPLRIGDAAPDFTLPAVNREGEIGLADYAGRHALFLGLFRGLHCPFCRRQVVQMNGLAAKLRELGIESVAVVNTTLARARLYYGRRAMNMALAVDPEWDTHRRYGLGRPTLTEGQSDWPRTMNLNEFLAMRTNPTGELPESLSPLDANEALNQHDGFEPTEVDRQIQADHGLTGAGYTLIGTDRRVHWTWLEGQTGMADIAKFPSEDEIFGAVKCAV